MIIMRGMGVSVTMSMTVVMRMIHLIATRIALMRAIERHCARDERADEWQENNSLNHCSAPERSLTAQRIARSPLILLSMI